jgi:hypothetical protein
MPDSSSIVGDSDIQNYPPQTKHFRASCLLDALTRRFSDEGAFITSGSGASKAFPFQLIFIA